MIKIHTLYNYMIKVHTLYNYMVKMTANSWSKSLECLSAQSTDSVKIGFFGEKYLIT